VKILLDTCTLLWIASDDPKLSARARRLCSDPENDLYLSTVSAWEIAVKHSQGRLPLPEPPEHFVPSRRKLLRIKSLAIFEEAAVYVSRLPQHHRDPFDRLLISQSIVHGLAILSPDPHLALYPVHLIW
jgi:PIN domain nuclease of toxin-antitoxin system